MAICDKKRGGTFRLTHERPLWGTAKKALVVAAERQTGQSTRAMRMASKFYGHIRENDSRIDRHLHTSVTGLLQVRPRILRQLAR